MRVRVGNQSVVWGEAFGAYYADIVNPKDLRQSALGDVATWRLPIPMVNVIGFAGDFDSPIYLYSQAVFQ